jgi:ribose transport system permease protein
MPLTAGAIIRRIETGLIVANLGLFVIFGILKPQFLGLDSLNILFRFISILGIMAIGEMFVILSGGIDLSPGTVIGLTGMVVAGLISYFKVQWLLAIFLTLLLGAAIGAWHAFFTTKLSPPMPQIAPSFLVTLGTLIVGRGVAQYVTFGYPILVSPIDQPIFTYLGGGSFFRLPIPLIFLLLIAAITVFVLYFTPFGRHVFGIGGSLEAARVSGVDINRTRFSVYVISTLLFSLAGILITAMLNAAYPATGSGYELTAISAVAIGGVSLAGGEGTPYGTLLGVTLVWSIQTGLVMTNVSPYLTDVITGIILIFAVGVNLYNKIRIR